MHQLAGLALHRDEVEEPPAARSFEVQAQAPAAPGRCCPGNRRTASHRGQTRPSSAVPPSDRTSSCFLRMIMEIGVASRRRVRDQVRWPVGNGACRHGSTSGKPWAPAVPVRGFRLDSHDLLERSREVKLRILPCTASAGAHQGSTPVGAVVVSDWAVAFPRSYGCAR